MKLLLALLLASLTPLCAEVKGAISLDTVTFNKVVGGPHFDVLVKFDKSYAYGDKQDQFKEFAKVIGEAPGLSDVLIADVGVDDYGEKKNDALRERFNIRADDFPVYRLFPRGSKVPIPFTGEVTSANLLLFVKQQLGVWIGLPGCLEQYDKLASGFLSLTKEEQQALLEKAADMLAKEDTEDAKEAGLVYVRTMKAVITDGNKAIEAARKGAERETESMKRRALNIVASFTKYRCASGQAGCLREMDKLSKAFLAASDAQRAKLYSEAQALKYEDEQDQEAAQVYLSCFKKIQEKGPAFVTSESARLNKLLGSQVSDNKKKQFAFKLVVLGTFGNGAEA